MPVLVLLAVAVATGHGGAWAAVCLTVVGSAAATFGVHALGAAQRRRDLARMRAEVDVLARRLRIEIGGAQDFLASARPPRRARAPR